MKVLLKKKKSQLVIMYRTGDWEQGDNTDNLKEYIDHFHDAGNGHSSLKTPSWDKKFVVICQDTSALFPIHENIIGKNSLEIKDSSPSPACPDHPIGSISQSLKDMTTSSDEKKDLDGMKKLFINVINLPDYVKLIYLQQKNIEYVTKSDIKKFQNDLTIKPGDVTNTNTQVELNYIH